MKTARIALALICLSASHFSARTGWGDDATGKKRAESGMVEIAKGGNQFATDLYRKLQSNSQDSLFFSPYSISSALAMTYVGAQGQTKSQMAQVLHFPTQLDQLTHGMAGLRAELMNTGEKQGFQLRVANRLWGQEGFSFQPAFLQTLNSSFGAELGRLDFKQAEAARQTINGWVEDQTEKRIQNLIPPGMLDQFTRLVLTNAIYFKAPWTHKFEKERTVNLPFHLNKSRDIEVATMQQTRRFRYVETDAAQILELPYGPTGQLAMIVMLPKTVEGLPELEQQLTADNLDQWLGRLKPTQVEVGLPKFKLTSQFNLTDTLNAMGMPLAFSSMADFSQMSSQDKLAISAVVHKAFVDVHEEGTEAAAATAIGMRLSAIITNEPQPVVFRADHPFAFLIRHTPTGGILFFGRMLEPKTDSPK